MTRVSPRNICPNTTESKSLDASRRVAYRQIIMHYRTLPPKSQKTGSENESNSFYSQYVA